MNFNDLLVIYRALVAAANKDLANRLAWIVNAKSEMMSKEGLGWSWEAVNERMRAKLLPFPFRYNGHQELVLEKNNKRCTITCFLRHDRESYDCGFCDLEIKFEVAVYHKYKAGKKGVPFSGQWVECKSVDKGAELKWLDDEQYDDCRGEFYSVDKDSECNELKQIVGDWWKLLNQI
jgi:hypothetical protein